jgi:hypothetical protein
MEQGIGEEQAKMVSQEHGFISTVLFEDWCLDVFFAALEERRERLQYRGEAVLIMDGLTCHDSDAFQNECFKRRCWIQILPPHSSDQTQPCDVGIFGPMKTSMGRIHPAADLSKQSKGIIKILGAMQQTLLPPTVVSAFRQAGICSTFDRAHSCLVCYVDARRARRVRGLDVEHVRDPVRRAGGAHGIRVPLR